MRPNAPPALVTRGTNKTSAAVAAATGGPLVGAAPAGRRGTGPVGRIPYTLVAALFVPGTAAYLWLLRGAEGFRFAHPWALALVPLAVGLCGWVGLRRGPGRAAVLTHSRAAELGGSRRGVWSRLADLPLVLRLGAVTLLAVALARPQTSRVEDDIEIEGIDIVLSLDLSGSMEETDMNPRLSRLDVAKRVIESFVARRKFDRLGLVVFGREAYTHVPLTLDHAAFLRMLGELELGIVDGRGTAIGNGLGVALNRLRRSDAHSKVVILLTDGDNNAGNISPTQAARFAQAMGVKVYTILIGDNREDAQGGPQIVRQRHPVNPKLLEEIASMTGGIPYLATDGAALAKRFQDILEELEKSRLRDRGILYADLFPRFLGPALILLLIETILRLTRLRRLP